MFSARLRRAQLRFPDAVPEDINYRAARRLDRALLARLLTGECTGDT
ncbi:transposase fragment, IS21 family [Cupriavidus taiwanensis]|uniref:Transposase n=4 Tax=Burkholderiaceae TaxID=119060 RepID=A0A375CRK2_9BURK|nr:transposase fragment, IS21 family [Cupriavidus taiwanensis LMG 19424]SOY76109.1 transposase fragment, IS21 family [Cupriavidus taiwanensis]SOZ40674.1 transposase fragment, IS21 family [Cupriavidus neocaledonicus]SOY76135.1 transposase fragment, IS21 family [Cupriavidus taiwanensis]SOY76396.1 transposase fragment, IS21 family [Cupriavidus taiwanensis]